MSLTNPNTPVSQKDLQDFYHRILPYLGGMPEMLANKFSKSDIYSTDEKMIGQWIDGKPLYQKVVKCGSQSAAATTVSIPHNIENVDFIRIVGAWATESGPDFINGATEIIPNINGGSDFMGRVTAGITNINIRQQGGWATYYVLVIVQYTKTTDSSISIGSDTDYSTEEKIVGTWIDGKKLYQKTYAVNISADGSNGNLIATDTSISFVVNGCVVLEGGTDWILINDTIKKMKSDGKIYCWTPGMGGATIKYVTIQYTKTV